MNAKISVIIDAPEDAGVGVREFQFDGIERRQIDSMELLGVRIY